MTAGSTQRAGERPAPFGASSQQNKRALAGAGGRAVAEANGAARLPRTAPNEPGIVGVEDAGKQAHLCFIRRLCAGGLVRRQLQAEGLLFRNLGGIVTAGRLATRWAQGATAEEAATNVGAAEGGLPNSGFTGDKGAGLRPGWAALDSQPFGEATGFLRPQGLVQEDRTKDRGFGCAATGQQQGQHLVGKEPEQAGDSHIAFVAIRLAPVFYIIYRVWQTVVKGLWGWKVP